MVDVHRSKILGRRCGTQRRHIWFDQSFRIAQPGIDSKLDGTTRVGEGGVR